MLDMYKGVVNSPETTITNDINNTDTLIYVLDETRVPEELPNLMTLGAGISSETIKVLSIEGSTLTVERGFQGIAKSWNAGTMIARNFTEYDYNSMIENIKTLKGGTNINADDISNLMTYVGDLESLNTTEKSNLVLALNEILANLNSHKAEMATKTKAGHIKLNEDWKYTTGENGWSNEVSYRKNSLGVVEFKGATTGGVKTTGTIIFTLPIGYRPSIFKTIPISTYSAGSTNAVAGFVQIYPTGEVTIGNAFAVDLYINFDGASLIID